MSDRIFLGTRKGTIILERKGDSYEAVKFAHEGVPVSFVARDPRTGTIWAGLEHGHWGPKLSRSKDNGETWEDAPQIKYPEGTKWIDGFEGDPEGPPADGDDAESKPKTPKLKDAKLLKIWDIAFGNDDQPGRIYVGTIPGGLFVSDDDGETFELNMPLWNHESRGGDLTQGDLAGRKSHWFGGGAGINGVHAAGLHSVAVDPSDGDHLYVGVSCAGVLETTDGGKTWGGRNKGMTVTFLPNPEPEWGHDPHFVTLCKGDPKHLWQQNHCGVFYSDNGAESWQCADAKDDGVHFGFAVASDEKDGKTAWLVPAVADDSRNAIDASLFVARTQDGGKSWERLTKGLPQGNAYDLVYRHALDNSGDTLAFGSTTGNVYFSNDRGDTWACAGNHFPPIYSVRFG